MERASKHGIVVQRQHVHSYHILILSQYPAMVDYTSHP